MALTENIAKSAEGADVTNQSLSPQTEHTGLVEELRSRRTWVDEGASHAIDMGPDALCQDAASAIEDLQTKFGLLKTLAEDLERNRNALRSENERLTRERDEAGKALVSLTPDGSEFYKRDGDGFKVDVEACLAFLRSEKTRRHEGMCKAVRARKAAETELQKIRAALKDVRAAITNENGLNSLSIACTVWAGPAETAVDRIDAALLDKGEKRDEPNYALKPEPEYDGPSGTFYGGMKYGQSGE